MSQKIILHCGAPKTGSTSFQHMLYANGGKLHRAGFYVPSVPRRKGRKNDIRLLLGSLAAPVDQPAERYALIRKVIEELFERYSVHTLIISNESFLGLPFIAGHDPFLPKADLMASRLSAALKGFDVDVRYFVRDYAGFLPSWYVQQVRKGSELDFEQFRAVHALENANWVPSVQSLRHYFGADNVEVFDHADLVRDPHGVLSQAFPTIMAALGAEGHDLRNKNSSIGKGMVSSYRRWNRIANRIGWSRAAKRRIQNLGRRYLLLPFESFSKSEKIRLEPELAAALSARFQQHLAEIRALSVDG